MTEFLPPNYNLVDNSDYQVLDLTTDTLEGFKVLEDNSGTNCTIWGKGGKRFNSFTLDSNSRNKITCDVTFFASTASDNKYFPRLTFRSISTKTNEENQKEKVRIDFSSGEKKKNFWLLINFLISFKDLIDTNETGKVFTTLQTGEALLIEKVQSLKEDDKKLFLENLRENHLTSEDINIITGRRSGIEKFKGLMNQDVDEKTWQEFFKNNSWILGYGLDYRFLNILQKEASSSNSTVGGKQTIKADFLCGCKKFTTLVELKKPDTPLFGNNQDRSGSWLLSKDLIQAVSQVLAQKAEWEIKSQQNGSNYNDNGEPITQETLNPKTILIIGNTSEFEGEILEQKIKAKTFERFKRSLRDIEIITYDELLDRAKFIVEDTSDSQNASPEDIDPSDLPF